MVGKVAAAIMLVASLTAWGESESMQAKNATITVKDGSCGMVGAAADGSMQFGGIGKVSNKVENGNKVTLTCQGSGMVNLSGKAQTFRDVPCFIMVPSGGIVMTKGSRATVAANGNGSLTCSYDKSSDT